MDGMTGLQVSAPRVFSYLFDPPLGGIRYRVAYGGRGSAKSWQFARALLLHGYQRKLRILCAREYQGSMKDSVHRLLTEQIDALNLNAFYTITDAEIRGQNGTEFIFKGLRRDIAQIKSTEGVDIVWVEEAEAVSDYSWQTLIPTIRKPQSEIWVTFNPALETDATYQRFVVKPPRNAIIRKVGYEDNPFLPQVLVTEQLELLEKDPDAHAHVWGGETWSRSEAQVLSGKWSVESFESDPQNDPTWAHPLYGGDFGFSQDPSTIVEAWVRKTTKETALYIRREDGGIQWDTDTLERRFKAVAGLYVIRADNARPETINELWKRGIRIEGCPKWPGSVEDGIQHLRSYDRIVIHPDCKQTAQEARLWRYKLDPRTKDVLPILQPGHDHYWDAIRYALNPFIRAVTPFQMIVA